MPDYLPAGIKRGQGIHFSSIGQTRVRKRYMLFFIRKTLFLQVSSRSKASKVRPNAVLYGAAIRACSTAGKWRVGLELLEVCDGDVGVVGRQSRRPE